MRLSVCMIIKDEEATLARILSQVETFADEIIVVDTGSSDDSKNIARQYTDKVYDFAWRDNFAEARNFAFGKATGEYLMWVDADDYITPEVCDKINRDKWALEADCVMCPYAVSFSGEKILYWYYRERIVRNCAFARFEGFIHEAIAPFGKIIYDDEIIIRHKKERQNPQGRNLKIYENAIKDGVTLDARQMYYYGRELYQNERYQDAFSVLNAFVTRGGLLVNMVDACMILSEVSRVLGNGLVEDYLFRALKYGELTSELCVKIGNTFFERRDYQTAIFWYESALKVGQNARKGAFVDVTYSEYVPSLQLCVCYYRLGDLRASERYNNRAYKAIPSDVAKQNKKFFRAIKSRK